MDTFNFKYIGNYDINNIKSKVLQFSEKLWNDYTFRQDKHGVHKHTKTVPIIWKEPLNPNSQKNDDNKYWSEYNSIKNDIDNLTNLINDNLCKGRIESVLLINLLKNKNIQRHKDKGNYFYSHHRLHIPIITNENVIFEIDNEKKYLKAGEIWLINNNDKTHGVYNNSNTDRIHMLIDWRPL